jgi:hypothetical protein
MGSADTASANQARSPFFRNSLWFRSEFGHHLSATIFNLGFQQAKPPTHD